MTGNKSTQSAPNKSRSQSKSRSRSWSREKLTPVTKSKLNSIGQDSTNVGNVYNYNGLRLKLDKETVMEYDRYGYPEIRSKAAWTIGGDLKIQLI
jgi:hypothetical protein